MSNIISAPAGSPYAVHGALHVDGAYLKDTSNEKYQLYGMSTHGIAWYPQYICKESFTTLKEDWKTNAIRLAMYTDEEAGYCSDGDKDKLRQLVKDGVKYATELGMYVIIDWHILREESPMAYKEEALAFFEEMSALYADYDNVLYEICNEPNGEEVTWEVVKAYAEEVIPVIRKNSPNSVVIVGTPCWSQHIHKAYENPLSFENVMYTLHFYADTHKDELRERMDTYIQKGLPVFVSEFGMCNAAGDGGNNFVETKKWFDLINKHSASFFCWNLGNRKEASSVILPSTTSLGNWKDEELNESGRWIREYFRNR